MTTFQEYSNKGLTGLANIGNTCFINSCIQVLSHTYELNNFLNKESYKEKLNNKCDSALLIEWDSLRKLMWSQNCIISPGKFVKTIQKVAEKKDMDLFTGYDQNDLPEFLVFIIDCFHNSICRKVNIEIEGTPDSTVDNMAVLCYKMIKDMYSNEYSEIWNLFYGVSVSNIRSLESDEILSSKPEPYFVISLSIPENIKMPSLIDCFNLYIEGEILEGDNAYFNEKSGKKENVKKQLLFWSFPSILVIDLKRINSNNYHLKNQKYISFPIDNLDLSRYVIGYNKNSYVYELYGICNHSGNVMGGHYTAFVKNANQKWYEYNDTSVLEIKNTSKLVSPYAYCLFYRKKQIN
jgi:ubiquitin C-terminal hydrolase